MILNTGTVKELKDLQTVGEKRAKLIHDWRTMNGHFKTVSYLCILLSCSHILLNIKKKSTALQLKVSTAKCFGLVSLNNLFSFSLMICGQYVA